MVSGTISDFSYMFFEIYPGKMGMRADVPDRDSINLSLYPEHGKGDMVRVIKG